MLADGIHYAYVIDEELAASAASELALRTGEVVLADLTAVSKDGSVQAELCDGSARCRLPAGALGDLPDSHQWKTVSRACEATQESQLPIRKDASVIVQADTKTSEGWVYAWATDVCLIPGRRGGWVPVECLAETGS